MELMIIACFVLAAGLLGLLLSSIFLWTEVKVLWAKIDLLREVSSNNLDLIESLGRSVEFTERSLKDFVTSTITNLEEKTKLRDWDFRDHYASDVLRDLIDYLELDWQTYRSRVVFEKRTTEKKS